MAARWRWSASALLVFPQAGARLSGFETGVVVMPLVKGAPDDTRAAEGAHPQHAQAAHDGGAHDERAAHHQQLVTTLLIPPAEFQEAGPPTAARSRTWPTRTSAKGSGRLRHQHDPDPLVRRRIGDGRACSTSCRAICRATAWPGVVPRDPAAGAGVHGIASPSRSSSARTSRPRRGAYATGVLVLMTSATIAVTLAARRRRSSGRDARFRRGRLIFVYTTVVTSWIARTA